MIYYLSKGDASSSDFQQRCPRKTVIGLLELSIHPHISHCSKKKGEHWPELDYMIICRLREQGQPYTKSERQWEK